MEKNEIKKLLYKEKNKAEFKYIKSGIAHYESFINDNDSGLNIPVYFAIPVIDMGEATFENKIQAQLLIRWIKN